VEAERDERARAFSLRNHPHGGRKQRFTRRSPLVADDGAGKLNAKKLGKWLATSANKIAGGHKLLRNAADKSRIRWQLSECQ